MERYTISPRGDWPAKVEELGLVYHSLDGRYWNESACYEFTAAEVDLLEAATNELHRLCVEAVGRVIAQNQFKRLCIPERFVPLIRESWEREDLSLYGRFDFCYDGSSPPKLYEYNADTPTSLLEAAVVQWHWLEEIFPGADQFNSIHEKLIARWRVAGLRGPVHFACVRDHAEDFATTTYLEDTAQQAGIETKPLFMDEIGWNGLNFVDLQGTRIGTIFKLYPWEWLVREQFGEHLLHEPWQVIEPAWKMILSNKAILALLWEWYPDHPNLLPAYTSPEPLGSNFVKKPIFGREGANVTMVEDGKELTTTTGEYGAEGFIYQALQSPRAFAGNYPVIGCWIIGDEAAGIGIRESDGPITRNTSRFVPHYFAATQRSSSTSRHLCAYCDSRMSIEVKVPAVGESISSGIVSVWHKKSGEVVSAGDPLFTLETDKVSTEIVAEKAGVLQTKVPEGQEVKIGEVVATIDDSAAAAAPVGNPAAATPTSVSAKPDPNRENAPQAGEKQSPNADVLSPAVRRIVEEEKLDAGSIQGSGKGGRLTKADALSAAENKGSAAPSSTPAPAQAPAPTSSSSSDGRVSRKKMSPLRRKIAAQLVMAQQTAAILSTFNECDMSAVTELRKKSQDAFTKKHGMKLGFMSFFIKAAVEGLKAVPAINSRIEGDDFIQNHYFDIGVAVGTERGLVVPVVRDADKKSFADLESDIAGFAVKAREGKIKIEDLQGGTFTISNGGVYGSLLSTPILNPPQSGILGMHTIQQRPVARDGKIEIRPMMYLALSYDHRAVDGKEAVTFLIKVKEGIEDPSKLPLDF